MSTPSEPKKEPTAAEAMLFFSIVKNTKNKADVDWEAVAVEQGFKNAEVAKVRFGQVKRKLGISSDASTPIRTPTKKKTAAAGPISASKVSKPRSKGKGRGKVKKELQDDDDDDDDDDKEPFTHVKAEQDNSETDGPENQLLGEMECSDPF